MGLWRQSEVVWSMVAQGVAVVSPYTALHTLSFLFQFVYNVLHSVQVVGEVVRREELLGALTALIQDRKWKETKT